MRTLWSLRVATTEARRGEVGLGAQPPLSEVCHLVCRCTPQVFFLTGPRVDPTADGGKEFGRPFVF